MLIVNIPNADDFLKEIAKSMGAKIVTWDNVNDAIDRNISFGMLVDMDRYLTKEEKSKLREKTFMGDIDTRTL